jgi:shikimate dehydrogenase
MTPAPTLVGLIGAGIAHSLTPAMHRREGAALGLDYDYVLIDLLERGVRPDAIGRLLAECRDAEFAAVNVTFPVKQLVIPHLDDLDPAAARIGAVNLVVFRQGRTIGFNVDGAGFATGLRDGLPGAALGRVVQFGGGGAGSATADALLGLGVRRLTIVDVDPAGSRALVARLTAAYPGREIVAGGPAEAPGLLAGADGAVNATPLGMEGHAGVPFDVAALSASAWVADVVYRPLETALLQAARARGLRTLDGGRMAVGQAVASLREITGLEPDDARVHAHFLELVAAEQAVADSTA